MPSLRSVCGTSFATTSPRLVMSTAAPCWAARISAFEVRRLDLPTLSARSVAIHGGQHRDGPRDAHRPRDSLVQPVPRRGRRMNCSDSGHAEKSARDQGIDDRRHQGGGALGGLREREVVRPLGKSQRAPTEQHTRQQVSRQKSCRLHVCQTYETRLLPPASRKRPTARNALVSQERGDQRWLFMVRRLGPWRNYATEC